MQDPGHNKTLRNASNAPTQYQKEEQALKAYLLNDNSIGIYV